MYFFHRTIVNHFLNSKVHNYRKNYASFYPYKLAFVLMPINAFFLMFQNWSTIHIKSIKLVKIPLVIACNETLNALIKGVTWLYP